jgi:hypothetical protein
VQGYFDDTKGGLALAHCADAGARAELEGGPALRCSHYLALGAAGALLHFLEQVTPRSSLLLTASCMHCCTCEGTCWSPTLKLATEDLRLLCPASYSAVCVQNSFCYNACTACRVATFVDGSSSNTGT